MTTTSSLLPTLRTSPEEVFSAWLSEQELSDSSKRVYFSMLSKFSRAMVARAVWLDEVGEEDIEAFLNVEGLEKQHRYRYVRLLERLYAHLIHVKKLRIKNPGSLAAREGVGRGENDDMCFLSVQEYTAISRYISCGGAEVGEEKKEKKEKQKPSRHWTSFSEWREARDLALTAVMLFGAVRVEEAGLLSVNCITKDYSRLKVPTCGRIPYHEAEFVAEGRQALAAWLTVRRAAGIPSTVLFPSDDLGQPMHPASIYRRVHRIMESALEAAALKLREARLSPQTLRNTYASMLIARGYPDRAIMDCMGIKGLRSMRRIRTFYEKAQLKP